MPGSSPTSESVLVLGAGGLLGRALVTRPGVRGLTRAEADVEDPPGLAEAIRRARPAWVINAAAFTQVDRCESEPERAFAVNASGAANVARACAETGVRLLHLSTDYVFDGRGDAPWREDDPVAPLSAYGRSKLAGEEAVRAILGPDALIVRAQWLYGAGGPDFVQAILQAARGRDSLAVVSDQRGTPTWTHTLADLLLRLIAAGAIGTVHASASGACTRAEWAEAILSMAGLAHVRVEPCGSDRYPRPAPRPANSVFDLGRYQTLSGHTPPHWRDALAAYFSEAGGA